MFKTASEAVNLVNTIKAGTHKVSGCTIVVIPPFTTLQAVSDQIVKNSSLDLGAQNMYPETEGAFTGEISPLMLKDLGCRYVVLGHSERRSIFKESNAFINKKVMLALKYSIIPILCIGETLEQRENRTYFEVVKSQLEESLAGLDKEEMLKTVIAYEPVWAIGTGQTASPEQAEQMHSYIRRLLNEKYGNEIATRITILYGGSVKPDNIATLMGKANVDGALVGGASLKAESFNQIVELAADSVQAEAQS